MMQHLYSSTVACGGVQALSMEWGASDSDLAARIAQTLSGDVLAQLSRPVLVCGTPVDLCRLYREVQRRGGFEEVGSREQWEAVAEALGFLGPEHGVLQTLSARITLAAAYAKYLRDFERQEMPDEEQQVQTGRGRAPAGRRTILGGDRLLQAQEASRLLSSVPPRACSSAMGDEIRALNSLTRITESGDFELLLEYVPELVDALAASLDRHNALIVPFRQRLARQMAGDRRGASLAAAVFSTALHANGGTNNGQSGGKKGPSAVPALFDAPCRPSPCTLEGQLVCGAVMLLQNLSFIAGNQEAIAYHPRVLAHLASVLHVWHGSELGLYACQTLSNLAKHLDVNGMPLPEDDTGVIEESLMALAPVKMRTQASTNGHDPGSADFVAIVYNTFPVLFDLLLTQDTGSCLLRCLDCLSKLCQSNEDNGQIVARYAPPGLFLRLHELLYVPANGLDSLPRGDGEKKAKAKEVPRYGFEDWGKLCDLGMLDASLELAVCLAAFRETRLKLIAVPGYLRSLLCLFGMTLRVEILARAAVLVRTLAAEERGARELEPLRPLLTQFAFRHDAAANLFWSLYVAPVPEIAEDPMDEDGYI